MKNGVIQRLIYLHSCASKVAQMHAHDIQVSKANIIILLQCLNISSLFSYENLLEKENQRAELTVHEIPILLQA